MRAANAVRRLTAKAGAGRLHTVCGHPEGPGGLGVRTGPRTRADADVAARAERRPFPEGAVCTPVFPVLPALKSIQ